jgi:RNA polymerase sigma factor (sigma-70 family)
VPSQKLADVLRYCRRFAGPKEGEDPSDGDLLGQFIARQEEGAFAVLLQRHGPLVLGVCRQILGNPPDAEDAFQAIFLVLARKAGSLRKHQSLAAWLHRVAVNVARRIRAGTARRRVHERQALLMPPANSVDEISGRDWHRLLHEEVDRLPEKYRVPIVLCYFDGKTHDEAGRQLAWPVGTVKGRLARARALLRARLARRGLTLSTAGIATVLTPSATLAHVPVTLSGPTLRAALCYAGKQAIPAGTISVQALALANAGLQAMTGTKFVAALALLLAVGVLTYSLAAPAPFDERSADPAPSQPGRGNVPPETRDAHGDPLPPGAIARLGTLRFRHGKGIAAIALAADGKTITSAGSDGSIVLHDATSGAKLRVLAAEAATAGVALAPDGQSVATVVGGQRIVVREATTGRRLWDKQVDKGSVHRLDFSADSRMLAGGQSHVVHVWDARTGKELGRVAPPGRETLIFALSPNGKKLATGGWDRKERPVLCLWETVGGRKLHEWQPVADMEETHALAFTPDGMHLASASGYADAEKTERLRIWAVPTGARLLEVPGRFHFLRYSPDGKVFAAEGSGAISLREADTGKELRRIPGGGPISFAADGKTLALADHYSTITFWDVATGKKLGPTPLGHGNCVRRVQFLGSGKTLASIGDDAAYFWQVHTAKSIGRFVGPVGQRVLSSDGKTMAALFWQPPPASRQRIGLWDTATGKKRMELEPTATNTSVVDFVFSPDGRTLAIAMGDRSLQFWAADTGKLVRQFALPDVSAESLAFSPDANVLAVGDGLRLKVPDSRRPKVRLIDAISGRELRKPLDLPETAAAQAKPALSRIVNMGPVIYSADGKMLAAAAMSGGNWGVENVVQVWEVATGQLLCRLERASNRFALSPDGKSVVTMAGDPDWGASARLWEVATGQLRAHIRGHLGSVQGAAFSPDGRLLATGSQDTTVLIWDALNLGGEPPAATKLSSRELEGLWADLGGTDAARAYRAIWALVAVPAQTVPYFKPRLQPIPPPDPKQLARLLADLDDRQFAARAKATRELVKLGRQAMPALRQVLAGQPSLEVRRRVQEILQRWQQAVLAPDELQRWRAVEALEHIGTAEARLILDRLGREGPDASLLERDARAAAQRLRRLTNP